MPLPFHLFAFFDVYFPTLLFGILSLSFLVHISGLEVHSRCRNCKWKLENRYDSFIDEDEIKYQENEIGNIFPPSKEQAKNTDRLLVIIRHEMQNV